MKEKLIELFKKTCGNFDVPRSNKHIEVYADNGVYNDIRNLFPTDFPVEKLKKGFERHRFSNPTAQTGFEFADMPPLTIGGATMTYSVVYGKFIPIISLFFWKAYQRRKKYCEFAAQKSPTYYYDMIEKVVYFQITKFYILQGTLISKISEGEFNTLKFMFANSVKSFDTHQLNKRLRN